MDHPLVILPEEQAPEGIEHCELCELSKQRTRVIWGEGNPRASLMMILDNPGAREDRQGNSFLCGTRETLQLGMREAGIDANAVYVTYLLKCRPMRAYNKPKSRAACLPHLQLQLFQKQPLILFGFGNVVAEAVFPDKESASVKELRGSWYEFQGMPISFTYQSLEQVAWGNHFRQMYSEVAFKLFTGSFILFAFVRSGGDTDGNQRLPDWKSSCKARIEGDTLHGVNQDS
ncbi:uracil-DNA glycosylase [Cohnella pontilimi]|uniref:uracil-DNA glycosylase n=1 Tax=Cohnella pontilimi TaxID=2564100 RepID=UPI001FE7D579|nr:uracil-DNA glycosylase [Cohnella pontilimi]